jgi:hypothetical protein
VIIEELYDALKEAGASEDKSRSAARALAGYENRFGKIESDLTLLKWMVGANIGLSLIVLGKLLAH